MSNERERALEAALEWLRARADWDTEVGDHARALLASSPPPSCEAKAMGVTAGAAPLDPWQPIATAPKDGTRIFVGWQGDALCEVAIWHYEAGKWMGEWSGFWKKKDWPTHWRPLPTPPSVDGRQTEEK